MEAEFESDINHITIDIGSSSCIPSPLPSPSLARIPPQPHATIRLGPLPYLQGCGPDRQRPQQVPEGYPSHTRASPFWGDVGVSMEGLENEGYEGGPKTWEAYVVRHENEPRLWLWFIFVILFSLSCH